jgi:hypothetical protein
VKFRAEALFVPENGLHRDEIDDAFELILGADRELDREPDARRGGPGSS